MAYIDEAPCGDYPRMMEWIQDQLLVIVPDAIARYFMQLAYGCSTSVPSDMPMHCRSTSFEQYKKAIFFYMPNKILAWCVLSGSGNPTKSVPVNDVLNTVRKMECMAAHRAPNGTRRERSTARQCESSRPRQGNMRCRSRSQRC
jgi:hypothetical protein